MLTLVTAPAPVHPLTVYVAEATIIHPAVAYPGDLLAYRPGHARPLRILRDGPRGLQVVREGVDDSEALQRLLEDGALRVR